MHSTTKDDIIIQITLSADLRASSGSSFAITFKATTKSKARAKRDSFVSSSAIQSSIKAYMAREGERGYITSPPEVSKLGNPLAEFSKLLCLTVPPSPSPRRESAISPLTGLPCAVRN